METQYRTLYIGCYVVNTNWREKKSVMSNKPLAVTENECEASLISPFSVIM